MSSKPFDFQLSGPAGMLEALFEHPNHEPSTVVVLGHPHPQYGGTMHNKVIYRAAKTFLKLGFSVLRFNFRGVGRSQGQWDHGKGEREDFLSAVDYAATTYPGKDLWTAGFSFGAWQALTCGVSDPRVKTLLGIAPPFGRYDLDEVLNSTKPTHLIHGEQDEIIPLSELQIFYRRINAPKTLTIINAANHLFEGRVAEIDSAIQNIFKLSAQSGDQA